MRDGPDQYIVLYTNSDLDQVPYDTAYTLQQRRLASVRCARKYGKSADVKVTNAADHPPQDSP